MNHNDKNIGILNKLLRGELSAIETYGQAIDKFAGEPEAHLLARVRAEHEESAESLRSLVASAGGVADTDSGPWGTFARAVEGAATLLGESAALRALLEGEERGIQDYEAALEHTEVNEEAKTTIRDALLPALFDHVATLDALRI